MPKADISQLFDYFVSGCEQGLWNGQAEQFGGLEIDDQLEFCRLLDRMIGWLGSSQNAVNLRRCFLQMVDRVDAVRHETAARDVIAKCVNRW